MASKALGRETQRESSFSLDRWWFGRGSATTLGLFRIIVGLVGFGSLGLTLFDFGDFYTEHGFFPTKAAAQWAATPFEFQLGPLYVHLSNSLPRISFLNGTADDRVTLAVYLAVMVLALLTALGLFTRVSSALFAIGVVSLQHRNPLILMSGDSLFRLCAIYVALAPSGAGCSLDRFLALWKGRASPATPLISVWGQRLVQYQVALVYFTTVWWKWFGAYWKNGTATWYPENLNEFYRFPVPSIMRHQPMLAVTTYGTLLAELSLATLVFYKPLRKYVLLAGIAMHGYIEYRFNIPFFALIIVSTYICFYEGEEIDEWAKRVGSRLRRFRVLVELPLDHALKPEAKAALSAADPFSLVSYDPGTSAEWHAMDVAGRAKGPYLQSFTRSPGAWPLTPWIWKRLLRRSIAPQASGKNQEAGDGRGVRQKA